MRRGFTAVVLFTLAGCGQSAGTPALQELPTSSDVVDAGPEVASEIASSGPCGQLAFRALATTRPNDSLDDFDGLMTPLPDGRLMIGMAESILDPRTETFEALPKHKLILGGTAVALADKKNVLLVGGGYADYIPGKRAALFDLQTHETREVAPMLTARAEIQAFLLPSAKVLVVGAAGLYGPVQPSGELYDPVSDSWSSSGPEGIYGGPESDRAHQTALQLTNGDVIEFDN